MTNELLKSTTVVSSMTLASRIVGFLRDMILAQIFGASAGIDAFFLAFKIPNFMRRLFAEGAFTQAFVPVLSEYKATKTHESIKDLINKVFCSLSSVLLLVTALGVIFAPFMVRIFAPGFDHEDIRFSLATHMLQITFPYIFFISLTAFAAGIQNAYGKFAIPAFTPTLLNLSLIFAALGLAPFFDQPVDALAWGVMLAGVVQLLFQVPFLAKLSLFPRFAWGWRDEGVKRIMTLMVPAIIGASVMQVNLLVDSIFASYLPVGSITWLYYSDRLLEFPIGIFGVALATVVLPHLSKEYAQKSQNGFSSIIDWAIRWILLIGIPATIGLMMMSAPLMSTLFQYGRFEPKDVIMASHSLMALSLGLTCFLAVKILVSAFYARQNTKQPVKIAVFCMALNVVFNALLIGPLAHAGLALSSSLSSIFNVLLLLWVLLREKIYIPMPGWGSFALRLLLANACMGAFLWYFTPDINAWLDGSAIERASSLMLMMGGAMAMYFGGLWLMGMRFAHMRMQSA